MRIYAVADIHAKKERLEAIQRNIDQHKPELLVVAGDITNYFQPVRTIERLNRFSIPVLAVRGNSDLPVVDRLIARASNILSIHCDPFRINGFHFIGLDGALILPLRTKVCLREKNKLEDFQSSSIGTAIWVMHPPPFGCRDRILGFVRSGSRSIREFIDRRQPMLFICGHIHEDVGAATVGDTLVVNCSMGHKGAGVIIDIDRQQKPQARFIA